MSLSPPTILHTFSPPFFFHFPLSLSIFFSSSFSPTFHSYHNRILRYCNKVTDIGLTKVAEGCRGITSLNLRLVFISNCFPISLRKKSLISSPYFLILFLSLFNPPPRLLLSPPCFISLLVLTLQFF